MQGKALQPGTRTAVSAAVDPESCEESQINLKWRTFLSTMILGVKNKTIMISKNYRNPCRVWPRRRRRGEHKQWLLSTFWPFFRVAAANEVTKGKKRTPFYIWRLLLFRDVNPIIASVIEMASLAAVSYQ
jgi:hypothetical protein